MILGLVIFLGLALPLPSLLLPFPLDFPLPSLPDENQDTARV